MTGTFFLSDRIKKRETGPSKMDMIPIQPPPTTTSATTTTTTLTTAGRVLTTRSGPRTSPVRTVAQR